MAEVKNVLLQVPWDLDERIERIAKQELKYKRKFMIALLEKAVDEIENNSPACSCKSEPGNDQNLSCNCKGVIE
jgi:hypothetical protein